MQIITKNFNEATDNKLKQIRTCLEKADKYYSSCLKELEKSVKLIKDYPDKSNSDLMKLFQNIENTKENIAGTSEDLFDVITSFKNF